MGNGRVMKAGANQSDKQYIKARCKADPEVTAEQLSAETRVPVEVVERFMPGYAAEQKAQKEEAEAEAATKRAEELAAAEAKEKAEAQAAQKAAKEAAEAAEKEQAEAKAAREAADKAAGDSTDGEQSPAGGGADGDSPADPASASGDAPTPPQRRRRSGAQKDK